MPFCFNIGKCFDKTMISQNHIYVICLYHLVALEEFQFEKFVTLFYLNMPSKTYRYNNYTNLFLFYFPSFILLFCLCFIECSSPAYLECIYSILLVKFQKCHGFVDMKLSLCSCIVHIKRKGNGVLFPL